VHPGQVIGKPKGWAMAASGMQKSSARLVQ
jgi:hypothetical protein